MAIEVLIVVDNESACPALAAEYGLSMLVRGPGRTILYDTGASGEALRRNAAALQIDLPAVDAVVLSHGHSDHTGGLEALAQARPGLPIYAHPLAFAKRWVDRPGEPMKDISSPHALEKLYETGAVFQPVRAPEMLQEWLVISGPVGGPSWGDPFFIIRKGDEIVPDGFEDENFLLLAAASERIVVTGCCHRGLKNTLRTAKFMCRDAPIRAIVGGLHLRAVEETELRQTAELLAQYGSPDLHLCHCTGPAAVEYLRKALPGKVHPAPAGTRLVF